MPSEPGVGRSRLAGQSLRLRTPCCAWASAQAFLRCRCPCYARKPGACRPWHARSPGKGSPGPFAMLRFTRGLGVRRDDPCALRSLLRLGTGPSHPWLGRSPGQQSTGLLSFSGSPTGHSPDSGSPTGHSPDSGSPMASPFGREKCHWHFSFIGLTPVGSAPASRG